MPPVGNTSCCPVNRPIYRGRGDEEQAGWEDGWPVLAAVELGRLTRHGDGHKGDPFRYGLAGRSSSLLPPLPDLEPLENEVLQDGISLRRAAKALAVLEQLRRREAERDANCGEKHE